MMRVYMFTRRHDRMAPRTKIGASQGDRGATRYSGEFERRYTSGFGLSLGADYVGLNPQGNGTGGGYTPSAWLQFSYAPSPRFGVQAQLVAQLPSLNLLLDDVTKDTLLREMNASRSDFQLRGSWRQVTTASATALTCSRHTPAGARPILLPGSQGVGQFGAVAARRGATWSAQLSTLALHTDDIRSTVASLSALPRRNGSPDHSSLSHSGTTATGRVSGPRRVPESSCRSASTSAA